MWTSFRGSLGGSGSEGLFSGPKKKKNCVHVHTPARWDTLEGVAASARMCSGVLRLGGAFSGDYISSFSQSDRKSNEVWNLCSGASFFFLVFFHDASQMPSMASHLNLDLIAVAAK